MCLKLFGQDQAKVQKRNQISNSKKAALTLRCMNFVIPILHNSNPKGAVLPRHRRTPPLLPSGHVVSQHSHKTNQTLHGSSRPHIYSHSLCKKSLLGVSSAWKAFPYLASLLVPATEQCQGRRSLWEGAASCPPPWLGHKKEQAQSTAGSNMRLPWLSSNREVST